jgi:predicted transcriptional regulator
MMTVGDVVDVLAGEPVCCPEQLGRTVDAFAASDLLSDVLAFDQENYALLTGLTNTQVVRTADITGAACIVIVRNKQPQQAAVALAQTTGIPIILSPFTMFEACSRLSHFTEGENDTASRTANPSGTRADVPDQSPGGHDG